MRALWLLLLPLLLGAAEPPKVRYVTKVVTKSWTPLELPEVEKLVEGRALAVLGTGLMRLERSGYAELKGGDYSLLLDGRFIEEAEKFSVYLTFGPGGREDLPSFHVSDTESLGGLAKPVMQKKIEALAEKAARRLLEVLRPQLEAARLQVAPPPLEEPQLPWEWGPIEAPSADAKSKLLRELLEVRNEDHVRFKALAEVKGQVFDQPPARDAVVVCMLRDPSPKLRAACAEALTAVARTHVPTQRLILHAMRREVDDAVLSELTELSKSFVGLSRKECIETWLELVAGDATPSQSAERVASLLAEEGEVPNLDLALAKCFRLQALAYGKMYACANTLLGRIPAARRAPIVWRYLQEVRVWDGGDSNVFERVRDAVAGRGSEPLEPSLAELFLSIAERRSAGRARDDALYQVGRHAAPTPALMERVLRLAYEPALTSSAMRAASDCVRRKPELAAPVLAALRKIQAEAHFVRQKYGGDHPREIAETIRRLEVAQSPR